MIDSPEAQFAVSAVREAALLAKRIQRELVVEAMAKFDRSPVTVADFAVQAVIAQRLAAQFPAALLVGEEDSTVLETEQGTPFLTLVTQYVNSCVSMADNELVVRWINRGAEEPNEEYWTLDPVDGTKGFLRGDQYVVALALVKNGTVRVGALGCPALTAAAVKDHAGPGSVVVAERGQGAWWAPLEGEENWQRLQVSDCANVADARLLRSVESGHTDTQGISQLVENLGIAAPAVPLDSQAKYAVLAAGAGEALLRLLSPSRPDYREKIWDQAAGMLIVEEAGGRVTDLDGQPLDFSHGRTLARNRGVLATNGPLHDPLLEGLKAIGA